MRYLWLLIISNRSTISYVSVSFTCQRPSAVSGQSGVVRFADSRTVFLSGKTEMPARPGYEPLLLLHL